MSPSASVADPGVQVKVEDSVALVGVSAALVKTGVLFVTVTVSVAVPVPPSVSVAVAVQKMVSPLVDVEFVRVRVELVPRVVEPLVQA